MHSYHQMLKPRESCLQSGSIPQDIYEIDQEVERSMKLSMSCCAVVDKDNVYCLICNEKFANSLISTFEHFRDVYHNNCLKEMIEDDDKFAEFPYQLCDLKLAEQMMDDISDEIVHCYACKEDIPNNLVSLHQHIAAELHCKNCSLVMLDKKQFIPNLCSLMKRNWYTVLIYWCIPCGSRFTCDNYYYEHLTECEHKNQCKRFAKNEELIFDYCPTCAVLFYGRRDSFSDYCQCKRHQYFSEQLFYVVNQLPTAVEKMLVEVEENENTKIRETNEQTVAGELKTIIQSFVRATYYPLGSIISTLDSPIALIAENSMLIKIINRKFPLCRKLTLFVKQWINYSNLSGQGGISSYAIAWMVIYYLQTKSMIVDVIDLIKASDKFQKIDGWKREIDRNFVVPKCSNFRSLLKDFFEMYANYDFRNDFICPLLGYPLKKEYDPLDIDSPMIVQNPYDLSNNLTRAIDKLWVYKFQTYCTLSAQNL